MKVARAETSSKAISDVTLVGGISADFTVVAFAQQVRVRLKAAVGSR
ncbi:MAG: hypothetical protein JWO85_480 [Candidatus Eremiobacteraeota bacterium]|jgi:hypothetical protein|nr:hypothetical protein [Candidatus Eremiobacteraeota bacterium]